MTDDNNEDLYKKAPSVFQMLKSFTKEATKFIKAGTPIVSEEDYAERLDACMSCKHIQKKQMRCGLCGCMLQFKARMKTTDCPAEPSKWEKQILNEKDIEYTKKQESNRGPIIT